jgi:hypothetical protein
LSAPKSARELYEPYCWNCGRDPRGRKLLTVPEAAAICAVAPGTVYRWMDEFRVQWVLTAGGQRRVYLDSLKGLAGSRCGRSLGGTVWISRRGGPERWRRQR